MKVDRIYTNINTLNFRENKIQRQANSENAILMLRDPKAAVRFQQNQEYARKADSVDSNMFLALGYKLYRTFSMFHKDNEGSKAENEQLNTVA